MVDFRFHLISIVAVFLALGLGILVGTGFLGGALVEELEGNIEAAEARNAENTQRITQLERKVGSGDDSRVDGSTSTRRATPRP